MKYHLIIYGCQMNKSDAERIAGLFSNLGWEETKEIGQADLILINTCSVRQSAEDRVFGQVNNFTKLKALRQAQGLSLLIGVTGCMPGRDKDGRLRAKLPEVDFWFPIKDLPKLPGMIEKSLSISNDSNSKRKIPAFSLFEKKKLRETPDYLRIQPFYQTRYQAFIPIQTGCNQFCTYCVVPHARGHEMSRPLKDILQEIKSLAQNGCLEVTLLGQTVNNYQAPDPQNFSKKNPYKTHFAALLWEINQIPDIQWIHFTAPHPLYMIDEVVDALILPKMVNYLHLPVQSGDNEVLKRMNRKHTRGFYLNLIKKIQVKKPNTALGTDIIVGFCGETEKQFQKTIDLYKKVKFDISYTAMYSPRSNTLAAKKFKDDVPQKEKKKRWNKLQKLMERITLQKNKRYVGKIIEVLPETKFQDKSQNLVSCTSSYLGHSREMKQVRFTGPVGLIGKIVKVKIDKALTWELRGKYET